MAISLKPQLLLLDEPTAGMSPEETHMTGEMVQALKREGMTCSRSSTTWRSCARSRSG